MLSMKPDAIGTQAYKTHYQREKKVKKKIHRVWKCIKYGHQKEYLPPLSAWDSVY